MSEVTLWWWLAAESRREEGGGGGGRTAADAQRVISWELITPVIRPITFRADNLSARATTTLPADNATLSRSGEGGGGGGEGRAAADALSARLHARVYEP